MRQKTPKTVITFSTTSDAMAFEAAASQDHEAVPGRIVPVPSEISAGCGLSWCAPDDKREALLTAADERGLAYEGAYTVMMY